MTEEIKSEVAPTSKAIKKPQRPRIVTDPEGEKRFEDLKRKYANAIAFLLVKNVPRKNLKAYFEESEEN
jgi:hypothetical protein